MKIFRSAGGDKSNQIRTAGILAAAFISFFIFGFSDVLKGSAIPEILKSTSIGYNTGGVLIGFTYFGFFSGTLGSVFLLKQISVVKLLGASTFIVCSGLWLFSLANSPILMFTSAFLTGAGGGLIDVTANNLIRISAKSSRIGRRLNQLAFFHGLGAIVSPLFAGVVLTQAADWHNLYLFAGIVTAVLSAAVMIFISRIKFIFPESEDVSISINPSIALLGGVLFFYMTLEAGISGWLVEYGRNVIGLNERDALAYLSLFFILLTAGRLLSSFYVDRIGLQRVIFLSFFMILILTFFSAVFKQMFFLVSCTGLFMASIFPTTVALISNELESSGSNMMGVFFAIAGAGGIFGPWMIGMLSDSHSLQVGFALLMVFSICALSVCLLYQWGHCRK